MANNTLNALKREGTGKGVARKLRQSGRVPAVVYGRGLDPFHISVDAREAEHLFHAVSIENTIIDLSVEGEKEPYETLVREIQTHPLKANLLHVDFLRIQKGVAVDVEIPVELLGVPIGVKLNGGVLEQVVHEIEVRCVPAKIPQVFEIDVSHLDLDDSIHVSDIPVPEGVELLVEGDQTVCVVAVPRVIEEAVAEAAVVEGEEPVEGEEGAAEAEASDEDEGGDEG